MGITRIFQKKKRRKKDRIKIRRSILDEGTRWMKKINNNYHVNIYILGISVTHEQINAEDKKEILERI